jgi:hypothetical protein
MCSLSLPFGVSRSLGQHFKGNVSFLIVECFRFHKMFLFSTFRSKLCNQIQNPNCNKV